MKTNEQELELIKSQKKRLRRFAKVFGTPDGMAVLKDLEQHFETHLPAFQGKAGTFDPLDAMRRDAYREVFLYCRHLLDTALEEQQQSNEINE